MVVFIIILLITLLMIGMPVGFTLIFGGSLGIFLLSGIDTLGGILQTSTYRSVNDFTFSAIPLFILMAHFISRSEIAEELFAAILKWIGHKSGGAGVATVLASAGFGTLSGSSIAGNSVMSQIAIPKMVKAKYSESLSAGLVSSSVGTLAALIPPSIPLILYGIQTQNSVGKLLIAGILPAVLLTFLLCGMVITVGIIQKSKTEMYSWKERWLSLISIWPVILLIIFMLAILYLGIATPTEAAAFGAMGALIIGLSLKRLNFKLIYESLKETVATTAMIFTILIGAQVFTYFIVITGVGNDIINLVAASDFSALTVLVLIILIYLVIGMFLDLIAAMILTLPLVYPIIIELGYDPIWFGVVLVIILEIGLITPPVGINLFITSKASGIPVQKVLIGVMPFIGILLLTVFILILFPQIVLYLPNTM